MLVRPGEPALPILPFDHDDDLLTAVQADGQPRLRVYRWPTTVVVLGRGSRPEVELELESCRADGVSLLQRRGGGCAVVIDPGNVLVALVLPLAGIGGSLAQFSACSAWLGRALAELGFPGVQQQGVSDLVWGGRKIGGACIYRARGLLSYGATLLAAPCLELHTRYLCHPPREPAYRQGRPHAEFVGRLLPVGEPAEHGAEALAAGLRARLHLEQLAR